ncbi:MAG: DUF2799 domain-containing protein [Pseudomonadales bacterium]|nr:DUF2799 domain-containing protein [Pseudomonadales bacterium]
MNESECSNANWQLIGKQDGVNGKLKSNAIKHEKACSEYGISINNEEYNSGHDEGLVQYCTDSSGFILGERGKAYNGVCANNLEQVFLVGYVIGKKFYHAQRKVNEVKSELRSIDKKAEKYAEEIDELSAKKKSGVTVDEINVIQKRIFELTFEAGKLEGEEEALKEKLAVNKHEFARLRDEYPLYN